MNRKAIDLYNEYIHGDLPRHIFLKRLAGNDQRINQSIPALRRLLDEGNIAYSLHMYPGTNHGFHNDSSAARYDDQPATLAWNRILAFYANYLV